MLVSIIADFLHYCKTYNFSVRSIQVFSSRLKEFSKHLQSLHIYSITDITYHHLLSYVSSGIPSVYSKKHRVWTLHQFFHYLKINNILKTNIASKLPYPKIKKKEPDFLSFDQLKAILNYFISFATSETGLRNLITILFLVFLGLRISSIININIQDININDSTLLVTEKGNRKRILPLPQVLCFFLYPYIKYQERDLGPLFLSVRNKRISLRSIQHLFSEASNVLGMHIYSRIFRHTAATELNKVAGLDVTKQVLGHRRRESTKRYVHLNSDVYVEYMRRHPFMGVDFKGGQS
jgi:site-specific recombinase XerD